MKVRIQCRECGCIKTVTKEKEVPVGDCKYCKDNFGWYCCKGEGPKGLEKHWPLQDGDLLVIDTALPHIVNDNEPNFDRIFSLIRNGGILFSKAEVSNA